MTLREYFEKLNYKNLSIYDELSENDRLFFDKLFCILIVEKEITWTNDKLAAITRSNKSTIEKRLARIEKAGLIIREHARGKDHLGNWRVISRIIQLNDSIYTFNFSNDITRRLLADYLFYQQIHTDLLLLLNIDIEDWNKLSERLKNVNNI